MEGETIYSFVIGRLHDLLVEEMEYNLQALEGVVELEKKLQDMENLLESAHVRKDKCTKEIIELADQLIDSIEMYVIRVVNKRTGIRERLLKCMSSDLRPKVCKAIEKITIKISDFIKSQSGDADASSSDSRRPYKVQDLSCLFHEEDFVGREEDINKLVSYLVDHEENEFRVISIYGMGGLGKTTLARKVYNDKKVLSHFQRFAFVCVSEQCRAEEILKHILQQLSPAEEEKMKSMTQGDVIESLQRVQVEKRCLIIIDDIWSVVDWESLNCGLVDESTGSKVLLTTRIKDVADKGFCYSLTCLSEDECWELCQNKIGTDRDPEIEKRKEELGRKMIAWCGGNPLAVCVLRGVLVTKGSLHEWRRFYESRGGEVYQQFNDQAVEGLLFSYKELPYPLRPCFLYMASLVEDEKIKVETLYMLWDAEGMILSKDRQEGETNMDVAERYLGELVGRCMIEAKLDEQAHPNTKRRYKFCWLHDLMRKLCLSIFKKEDYLEVHDYRGRKDEVLVFHSSFSRNDTKLPSRQVFYFPEEHDFIVQDDKHNATGHVRSLMFKYGRARKLSKLKKLNLLRVLSFNDTSIGEEDITNELIHLRYLSLNSCCIVCLPSSIYDFIYLQTLDMRVYNFSGDEFRIPNLALRKLKGLKHLFLPHKRFFKVTPKFSRLRLDGLTKLETLVNLDSMMCEMEDVIHITNLRRLECTIWISSEDDGKKMKEFMNKVNLDRSWHSSLEIELVNPKVEMYSDVLRGQIPECCEEILHKLTIREVTGKLLPEFSKFSRLTDLELREFEVEEDPMPTLEKLSNLETLELVVGKLKGKEMTCSSTGFPKLKFLFLQGLENLEKWCVKEGAMPNLRRVGISGCSKLEMLPEELKFIPTFEELVIGIMPEEFKRRLICRGEDGTGEGPKFYKSQPRYGWDSYKISRRR